MISESSIKRIINIFPRNVTQKRLERIKTEVPNDLVDDFQTFKLRKKNILEMNKQTNE
jgi:hypothetical protein